MKRTTTMALAAAAAVALFASTGASTVAAQSPRSITLGISAGAAIPAGDFADVAETGFNGTVSLGFQPYGSSVGLRVDGMYNKFSIKNDLNLGNGYDGDPTIIAGTANLVFSLPGQGIRPYLIGGGGIYGLKSNSSLSTNDDYETDVGVNGGIGAAFPLAGFSTFIEARFHHIFSDPGSVQFVPVTFGISF